MNNDSGTRLLRSLLKINDAPNNERKSEKPNNHEQIKTQEFYRSPPSKTQLPFPVKLIDERVSSILFNEFFCLDAEKIPSDYLPL